MSGLTVKKIADYFRVSKDGRIVSTHRTEKEARREMARFVKAEKRRSL